MDDFERITTTRYQVDGKWLRQQIANALEVDQADTLQIYIDGKVVFNDDNVEIDITKYDTAEYEELTT